MSDPLLELSKLNSGKLDLFYCYRCLLPSSGPEYPFGGTLHSERTHKAFGSRGANADSDAIWGGLAPFFYRFDSKEGSIELLQYCVGGMEADQEYEDYPNYFPEAAVSLEPILPEHQAIISQLNDGSVDEAEIPENLVEKLAFLRHQIGGEPRMVQAQTDLIIVCPCCSNDMPMLASFGTYCLDPRGFASDEWVQTVFHICRSCCVIGVYNQCD